MAEFIEYALHDLLGPLSSILLWEDLLRVSPDDLARRNEALTAIHDSVQMMARMLYDMLDVTRAHAGRLVLHTERMEMDVVLGAAIAGARERGTPVDMQIEPALWVCVDRARLAQAVDRMVTAVAGLAHEPVAVTCMATTEQAVIDVRRGPAARGDEVLKPSIETAIASALVALHGGQFVQEGSALRAHFPLVHHAPSVVA